MIDHHALIRDVHELTPLPASTLRLVTLFSSEDWTPATIAETASLDAPLTARILRIANSAGSGSVASIGTVSDAIARIGAVAVVRLATGAAVRGCMSPSNPRVDAGEDALWRHSIATALSTELIGLLSDTPIPAEAYTAALLHDIGRVVLSRNLDSEMNSFLARAVDEGSCDSIGAERELLGVDHAEIGALMAEHWNLPSIVSDSIRFHHLPGDAPNHEVRTICDSIAVADAVARSIDDGGSENTTSPIENSDSLERLGMSDGSLDDLGEMLDERLEAAMSQYE